MPVVTPVADWGSALMTSLAGALAMFFSAIPKVLGFIIIVAIGWFLASLIERGIAALLRMVRFNDLSKRAGFSDFVQKMGIETDASGFLALVAKWFIRLITLVVAFDALGLPAVSDVLRQMLLWLPNLVVAMVVLVIGGLIATAVSDLVRGATAKAGFDNPDTFARIASVLIWTFAVVVAVNQVGIASTLVNTLFMGAVGAIALAAGLAFGLGGREFAARVLDNWYNRGRRAAPKMERAADELEADAAERAAQVRRPTTAR